MPIPTVTPDNHADLPVEQISPDVSLQWIDGGRILVTRSAMHDPSAYDRWEARLRGWLDQWPMDRMFCMLYDFRSPRFGLTLYTGTKIRQIGQEYGHIHGATAFLYIDHGPATALIATLKMIPFATHTYREFFTDYDQAVAWLKMRYSEEEERLAAKNKPDENINTRETGQ